MYFNYWGDTTKIKKEKRGRITFINILEKSIKMGKENVKELSAREFDDFIKKGLVFVDFFAEWCMPCVMMGPIVDEVSGKFPDISFGKVNISDNEALARKFGISSIPNFVLFHDGKPVEQFVGAMSEEELEARLKKHA